MRKDTINQILKAGVTKIRYMDEKEWLRNIAIRPKEILSQNSKMKKNGIFNVTFPAQQSLINRYGVINTCENAKHCKKYCYASQGAYTFSRTMIKHARNLDYIFNDPFGFTNQLIQEIVKKRASIIRIHDSGDFKKETWIVFKEVMLALPEVQFYAYTKKVSFFLNRNDVPKNFTYVFSYGGTEDHLIDPIIHRHSRIFSTVEELVSEGYVDTHVSDLPASNPHILKIGLVVHGLKPSIPKYQRFINSLNQTSKEFAHV